MIAADGLGNERRWMTAAPPPRCRALPWLVLALTLLFGAGCSATTDNRHLNLPAPVESTTLGSGDVFQMQVVGEREWPNTYQVAADGTIDVPYIHRITVEGLEPQQVADLVRLKLQKAKIRSDASVIVQVTEYNSKRIGVLGQVGKPGVFPFRSGMTFVDAVTLAGGPNAIANQAHISLTRRVRNGSKTVTVSFEAIREGRAPDIPLQAGDQIYVNERIF